MNKIVTSRDAILESSRKIILKDGLEALSIRAVASQSGISIGSVYNYFTSKSDLLCAAIRSIWEDVFHHSGKCTKFQNVEQCIHWLYECMEYANQTYPGFLGNHSIGLSGAEKLQGKKLMEESWHHMQAGLCAIIHHDPKVRSDAFNESFTAEKFSELIFFMAMSAGFRQDYDSTVILEIVRRSLY